MKKTKIGFTLIGFLFGFVGAVLFFHFSIKDNMETALSNCAGETLKAKEEAWKNEGFYKALSFKDDIVLSFCKVTPSEEELLNKRIGVFVKEWMNSNPSPIERLANGVSEKEN